MADLEDKEHDQLSTIDELSSEWGVLPSVINGYFVSGQLRPSVHVNPYLLLAGIYLRDTVIPFDGVCPREFEMQHFGDDVTEYLDLNKVIKPLQGFYYRPGLPDGERIGSDRELETTLLEDFEGNILLVLKENTATSTEQTKDYFIYKLKLGRLDELSDKSLGAEFKVSQEEKIRFENDNNLPSKAKPYDQENESSNQENIVHDAASLMCRIGNQLFSDKKKLPAVDELRAYIVANAAELEMVDISRLSTGVLVIGTSRVTERAFKERYRTYTKEFRNR